MENTTIKSPNKAKTFKSINNPYKKLCLSNGEKIRIDTVKEYAKLFGKEFKTRKRGTTEVDNLFCKNDELKDLMEKKAITPDENKKIHELIEKDIESFQKDFGYLQKAKEPVKQKRGSITGLNLRKNLKNKVLIPAGKGALSFAKNHKIGLGVTAVVAFSVMNYNMDIVDKAREANNNAYHQEVIEYQDNNPGNILDLEKTLKGLDYAKFVEKISDLELRTDLKFEANTADFKEFDKMYGKYMSNLQSLEKGKHGIELTQEEGRTFLVMQYIATNSYIDYLNNKSSKLDGKDLERNDYLKARFQIQLNSIKEACSDMKFDKNGSDERKIKTGSDISYTYYTNHNGNFVVNGLDQKEFKY